MAASTGPVLAAGIITAANILVINPEAVTSSRLGDGSQDKILLRLGFATAIAAGGFALFENFLPRAAVTLSWVALLSVLLVRVDPNVPTPLESLERFYTTGR